MDVGQWLDGRAITAMSAAWNHYCPEGYLMCSPDVSATLLLDGKHQLHPKLPDDTIRMVRRRNFLGSVRVLLASLFMDLMLHRTCPITHRLKLWNVSCFLSTSFGPIGF